ncbi:GSCFA domain-containing protein [Halomonas lysinitropha]|uniref:GSCFA family protein n=1 Tax=Halomonas lysinitropha TaxID=2607506 RepID=A0A5K1I5P9_9GAMM|nr:GSCFA domain-containing protein [Halomonas lysinitropha]VVZ95527.1 GSCFA family protein [Halomonas lysinitropha]
MNPYRALGEYKFWRSAIANKSIFNIENIWLPKFSIKPRTRISTYGSCFAQHIARHFRERGYKWVNREPAPKTLSDESKRRFSYEIFSSRSGNIYTTSYLYQLLRYAFQLETPPELLWEKGDRFYDPLRPSIEPDGFLSKEELLRSREVFLSSFRESVVDCDVFVFTLGLTESWFDVSGFEYPICPGTVAGEFDQDRHLFKNQGYNSVKRSLVDSIKLMREHNPRLKFLLTVSPVPLTATMSGHHVLPATTYSKSTLRAVAGDLAESRRYVDYFPSYELISSAHTRGIFYDTNARTVVPNGVSFVMDKFFECLGPVDRKGTHAPPRVSATDDVLCDEEILDSFSTSERP